MGLKVTGLSHAYTANLITGEQQKISPIAAHEFLKHKFRYYILCKSRTCLFHEMHEIIRK